MLLRSTASPGAFGKVVLLFAALTARFALGVPAQQPTPAANASAAFTLPKEVQEKLDNLQVDLKAAQIARDAKAEAATLNSIGDLYFRVSEFSQALDTFTQALDQARSAHDEPQQAAALNGTAYCNISLSEYDKGTQTAQQALDLATASNDARGQAGALTGLGWAQYRLGQSARRRWSTTPRKVALPLAQQSSDEDLQAKILLLTGLENFALGNGPDALDQFTRALALFQKVGDQSGQARTLIEIGTSRFFLGDMQAARYAFIQAMPMFDQTGDRIGKATALMMIRGALSTYSAIEVERWSTSTSQYRFFTTWEAWMASCRPMERRRRFIAAWENRRKHWTFPGRTGSPRCAREQH